MLWGWLDFKLLWIMKGQLTSCTISGWPAHCNSRSYLPQPIAARPRACPALSNQKLLCRYALGLLGNPTGGPHWLSVFEGLSLPGQYAVLYKQVNTSYSVTGIDFLSHLKLLRMLAADICPKSHQAFQCFQPLRWSGLATTSCDYHLATLTQISLLFPSLWPTILFWLKG